jgi:hypothetical protein
MPPHHLGRRAGLAICPTTAIPRSRMRVGITAAVVQVIGLLRWPILVPGYTIDANSVNRGIAQTARDSFATANDVLGTVIGETFRRC